MAMNENPNGHAQKPREVEERGNWANKAEFILTVMGAIIGPGNVWRFPYLCYRNGGGVFFIPYLLFIFTCGIPLFFLETALGQYTSQGGITCWRKICPLFQGMGYASHLIITFSATSYIIILAWAFFYLFSSFSAELPWASCGHDWNTVPYFPDYKPLLFSHALNPVAYTTMRLIYLLMAIRGRWKCKNQTDARGHCKEEDTCSFGSQAALQVGKAGLLREENSTTSAVTLPRDESDIESNTDRD